MEQLGKGTTTDGYKDDGGLNCIKTKVEGKRKGNERKDGKYELQGIDESNRMEHKDDMQRNG